MKSNISKYLKQRIGNSIEDSMKINQSAAVPPTKTIKPTTKYETRNNILHHRNESTRAKPFFKWFFSINRNLIKSISVLIPSACVRYFAKQVHFHSTHSDVIHESYDMTSIEMSNSIFQCICDLWHMCEYCAYVRRM